MLSVLHIISTYWHNPDDSCTAVSISQLSFTGKMGIRIWDHCFYEGRKAFKAFFI